MPIIFVNKENATFKGTDIDNLIYQDIIRGDVPKGVLDEICNKCLEAAAMLGYK